MVFLNQQHINEKAPNGAYGGAMCTCAKCVAKRNKEKKETKPKQPKECPSCIVYSKQVDKYLNRIGQLEQAEKHWSDLVMRQGEKIDSLKQPRVLSIEEIETIILVNERPTILCDENRKEVAKAIWEKIYGGAQTKGGGE